MNILAFAADGAPSVEAAAAELIKTGVLGAVLVLVGAYAFWVTRQWNQAQADRVADQQKVTDTLLKFSTSMGDVMRDLKGAIDSLKNATDEERKAIGIIDAGLTEIDRNVDKAVDTASKVADQVKTLVDDSKRAHDVHADDSRRAHSQIQATVDDLVRRLPKS